MNFSQDNNAHPRRRGCVNLFTNIEYTAGRPCCDLYLNHAVHIIEEGESRGGSYEVRSSASSPNALFESGWGCGAGIWSVRRGDCAPTALAAAPATNYYQIAVGAATGATISAADDTASDDENCTLRDAIGRR